MIIIIIWYNHQKIIKGTGGQGLGNKRTSGDHPNYYIIESSGDLSRLAVTQTPVKDRQLTLM